MNDQAQTTQQPPVNQPVAMPPSQKRPKRSMIIISVIFIILLVFAVSYLLLSKGTQQQTNNNIAKTTGNTTQNSVIETGLNEVAVSGEMPSADVVTLQDIDISNPGFILIRRDNQGAPAEIIGLSEYLSAGKNRNINVTLTKPAATGEILYAMVYIDNTGNQEFDFPGDEPAKDPDGNLAIYSFFAGGKAPDDESMVEETPVSDNTGETTEQ